jgi:hypothetical protein
VPWAFENNATENTEQFRVFRGVFLQLLSFFRLFPFPDAGFPTAWTST